jgi:hypothetical protein
MLVPRESEGGSKVVTGTVPIFGFEASVLVDSRAYPLFCIYYVHKTI